MLLWLWPKIRAVYDRCELQVELLDRRMLPASGTGPSEQSAAAEPAALAAISGAHAHGESRGARVPGGHVLLVAMLCAVTAQAAPSPDALNAVHNAFRGYANPFRMGEPLDPQGGGSQAGPEFRFDGSYNLLVNCITGCSASSGFTDNSAFTVGTSTINPIGALYLTSTPSISSGNAGRVRMDANSYLFTDCVVGCSGGSTTPADAFANPSTAGLQFDLLAGFNGTTWDRLRDDSNKYLYVDVANSSIAVTGTFWQTTQPVSGTFWQSTQPVSCATAATCPVAATDNLTEVGGSSFALGQQLAAASLPVVLTAAQISTLTPPSSVTATQSTGSNLHMVCDSGCSSSAGFADNSAFTVGTTAINPIGGLYDTGADPLISNGNAGRARIDSHSYLLVDGSQVTQPVSGTFWQTTQPVSGTFWQTTQPVSLASLPALVAGTAIIGKVDIDQTTPGTTNAVSATNFPSTVDTNTGNASASTIREALATNNPAIAAWGQGATGSAVPSGAQYTGGNGSGNLTGQIMCDSTVIKNALASSGETLLVAAPGSGKNTYICGFTVNGASTTLNTVKLQYGTQTSTACDTGATDLSVAVPIQAPTSIAPAGQNVSPPSNVVWKTGATNNQVCVNLSAAQSVNLQVWYTSF